MIKINQTYTVKSGDTLYGISNQFGVSVTELAELNNIYGSNLQVGRVLTIPTKSATNPDTMFMYTVKSGDSLYKIASKYGTTVQKIIDLNYLKSTNLSIGQVLRIPEMYTPEEEIVLPQYSNYTVKKGDSLYSIAKNNNISVDTLIQDNSLTSNILNIGQQLKIRIPSGVTMEVEECFGEDYIPDISSPTNTVTYVVKRGDSLYSISQKYNVSVNDIINTNNLKSNILSIGQELKIPSNNSSTTITYTVKKGDSLYLIAKKYNTTVDNIKRKNNLTSNNLSIGQVLKI
ncbi:MAG: LysM peptidoglycan-binding domain-containing protein [Bacilli bacterium]|nr:LysM peptidoglycan-binding domain-containing protein [Bacilli bacterium]